MREKRNRRNQIRDRIRSLAYADDLVLVDDVVYNKEALQDMMSMLKKFLEGNWTTEKTKIMCLEEGREKEREMKMGVRNQRKCRNLNIWVLIQIGKEIIKGILKK